MRNLLILGAGGHGKVVADIARQMNFWENISFLDDDENKIGKYINNYKVIGKLNDYIQLKNKYDYAFVAIGNNRIRLKWVEILKTKEYKIPIIKHNSTVIGFDVNIGIGTVVMPGVVINTKTKIGMGSIINTSSSIDHDCYIDDGVHISPGVVLGGNVFINKGSWIGLGAKIINNITIGKNSIVAAGAVVINDVPDNVMVVGVPAKIKKKLED
ncbi:sugar O-acyltransferase, sialic acid O-acetyltransferase NeuD family [Marinitoga hydrogenitolerans DSM 16785]|uniref:Sugar O-acyltransferase, sialic acid O-acetyltransferase NeuD family n=1 Tax=Marinitoga hydrogenitolerans (strain DSM 16785 / JCM 12826 / AT1271) TaxID=1122195 RepID=A0A1M4YXJ5_MARH1|nr:acetyltransferase [Marinitoga hydrogenitolerans]SHF10513.1 sugar O-acyltransferase, sialic acid O-acetyltransferase NeuD family [Marinitoga hydrogenitolerans DSM 16785]